MFAVPGRTVACTTPGIADVSPATPTSTTTRRIPCNRANWLIAAPPAEKLATICKVTSEGHAETPSATTPWSPAITTAAASSREGVIES